MKLDGFVKVNDSPMVGGLLVGHCYAKATPGQRDDMSEVRMGSQKCLRGEFK